MPTFIALLRGINVGGNRKILMTDLRDVFVAAGAREVVTYIQSGNVVFAHASKSAAKLAADLEARIAKATGFTVPVVMRTSAELDGVISNNPFEDTEHVHVSFLPARIPADALASIANAPPERFAIVDREIYLLLPTGVGRSPLAAALARAKPVASATTRNWRTVLALQKLADRG